MWLPPCIEPGRRAVAVGRRDEGVDRVSVGRAGRVDDVLLTWRRRERVAYDGVLDEVQQVGGGLPAWRSGRFVECGGAGNLSDASGAARFAQFDACRNDVLHDAVEFEADWADRHEGELAQRLPDLLDGHAEASCRRTVRSASGASHGAAVRRLAPRFASKPAARPRTRRRVPRRPRVVGHRGASDRAAWRRRRRRGGGRGDGRARSATPARWRHHARCAVPRARSRRVRTSGRLRPRWRAAATRRYAMPALGGVRVTMTVVDERWQCRHEVVADPVVDQPEPFVAVDDEQRDVALLHCIAQFARGRSGVMDRRTRHLEERRPGWARPVVRRAGWRAGQLPRPRHRRARSCRSRGLHARTRQPDPPEPAGIRDVDAPRHARRRAAPAPEPTGPPLAAPGRRRARMQHIRHRFGAVRRCADVPTSRHRHRVDNFVGTNLKEIR